MRFLTPLLAVFLVMAACDMRSAEDAENGLPVEENDSLTVFLVVLNNDSPAGSGIGCNDQLVPYTVSPPGVGEEPVSASIRALFALQDPPAPFANALSGSALEVESVWLEGAHAEIYLSGDLVVYGVCHVPRIEWQLKETVRSQAGVESVDVYVNGEPLADILNIRG